MDCGKRKSKDQDIKTKSATLRKLHSMGVSDMRNLIKKELPDLKGIQKRTRSELCNLIYKHGLLSTHQMGFISYDGVNSCYIDSFMTSFLMQRNKWIRDNILNAEIKHTNHPNVQKIALTIQFELKRLRKFILKGDATITENSSCTQLRRMFRDFEIAYKKAYKTNYMSVDWTREQNDPSDVIDVLNRVFSIPDNVQTNRYSLAYNGIRIFVGDKGNTDTVHIKQYIPVTKEIISDTRQELITEYKKADILYVAIDRNYNNERKSNAIVKPLMEIRLKDNDKTLKLKAMLIHIGTSVSFGHYIALLCINKKWILYDDMSDGYKTLNKNTQEVFEHNNGSYLKNVVGFIYA